MELCNYHSGQHCGWDCFQMDCAHGPSPRTLPPIVFFSASELRIEKLCGILNHVVQDRLLSWSPFYITVFPRAYFHRDISRKRKINSSDWAFLNKFSKKTHVDLQKRFLENHARCNFESRLSNPPGSRGRRNNAVWIVTWNNSPLRTHSTSLKWCSTNFLTENSSSRNSWSLFNSSNFWILLTRESRSARSRSANSSWCRACSRLDCSYPVRVCPISTAWESICLFNSQILFSARSAQYSCLRISDFASASNCSLSLSKMSLNWQLSSSWSDLRFCDIQITGLSVLTENWLCTWKQA